MTNVSNRFLFDQSYSQMNGLMMTPFAAPNLSAAPLNNPGVTQQIVPSTENISDTFNKTNLAFETDPYSIDDFRREISSGKPQTVNSPKVNGEENAPQIVNPNAINNGMSAPSDKQGKKPKIDYTIDDGKISFKSKIKNFGKGLISPVTNLVKHPIASVGALAAGALLTAATGGAIIPVFIGLGVTAGAFNIVKGIVKQATAKTDAQAESAWQNIGSGTIDIGLSVIASKKALKASGNSFEGNFFKSTVECFKNIPSAIKTSFEMVKDGQAWFNIKNVFTNLFKKTEPLHPEKPEVKPQPEAKPEVKSESPSKPQRDYYQKRIEKSKTSAGKKALQQQRDIMEKYRSGEIKTPETKTPDVKTTPKPKKKPKLKLNESGPQGEFYRMINNGEV